MSFSLGFVQNWCSVQPLTSDFSGQEFQPITGLYGPFSWAQSSLEQFQSPALPISVTTSKRSSSDLRRLKTLVRNTMKQERLRCLSIMNAVYNSDLTDKCDPAWRIYLQVNWKKVHFWKSVSALRSAKCSFSECCRLQPSVMFLNKDLIYFAAFSV